MAIARLKVLYVEASRTICFQLVSRGRYSHTKQTESRPMILTAVSIITAVLLVSQVVAQSALQSSVPASTATCLKSSVIFYTSDASTYVVTDLGLFVSSSLRAALPRQLCLLLRPLSRRITL